MSPVRERTAIIGVGVAACAVCCAGPIIGVLAAIGVGSAAGFALFGTVALLIGVALAALVLARRRTRTTTCTSTPMPAPVPVEFTGQHARS